MLSEALALTLAGHRLNDHCKFVFLLSFVTFHSPQLSFCLHPLTFSNRVFVTDVAGRPVRALRRRLLLTSATEITLSGSDGVRVSPPVRRGTL